MTDEAPKDSSLSPADDHDLSLPRELAREARELAECMQSLPQAYVGPVGTGVLRARPEDFVVEEIMGFDPSGDGAHLWLWVEKCGLNTDQVARALAKLAGVPGREVGFAGLKDRHAITRQWFSVPWAMKRELPSRWAGTGWHVCRVARHPRKLRRGTLSGNRFLITLRECVLDEAMLPTRLAQIATDGVPNFFTEQRFGTDNLSDAAKLFAGRNTAISHHLRGILFSAARAALFNLVLARRVQTGCWRTLLPGEAVQLRGSNSFFVATEIDTDLEARLHTRDIVPTGPLWGNGGLQSQATAAELELDVLRAFPGFRAGLEYARLDPARRTLVVYPQDFTCHHDPVSRSLTLQFGLTSGAYATGLLRELVQYIPSVPH